jgi:hypothetical protein
MSRQRLPNRRRHLLVDFVHGNLAFTADVGLYPDGRIGEIVLSSNKPGSTTEAIARDAAIVISIAIQHGADLNVIRSALTQDSDGAPATSIGAALDAVAAKPEDAP